MAKKLSIRQRDLQNQAQGPFTGGPLNVGGQNQQQSNMGLPTPAQAFGMSQGAAASGLQVLQQQRAATTGSPFAATVQSRFMDPQGRGEEALTQDFSRLAQIEAGSRKNILRRFKGAARRRGFSASRQQDFGEGQLRAQSAGNLIEASRRLSTSEAELKEQQRQSSGDLFARLLGVSGGLASQEAQLQFSQKFPTFTGSNQLLGGGGGSRQPFGGFGGRQGLLQAAGQRANPFFNNQNQPLTQGQINRLRILGSQGG